MSIENSRPAFPTIKWERDEDGNFYPSSYEGMTLRDHFAGLAMQGAFTSPIAASQDEKEYIAKHSYLMADAMLEAREEG